MQIGMIGLGRTGGNLVRRLIKGGHRVVGFDPNANVRQGLEKEGMIPAENAHTLVQELRKKENTVVVWLTIPSGPPIDEAVNQLLPVLSAGDVIVDGGNSRYTDTIRRGKRALESGIEYLDVGMSDGNGGQDAGYCMMVGGTPSSVRSLDAVFKTIAPPDGYLHVGPSGAGHFVKMVHNGIEYALLQAYGEGFDLLKNGPFDLDLPAVSHLWNQGSVIGSRLLELLESALEANPTLSGIRGYVEDSGEGKWAAETAIEYGVFAPSLMLALMERLASRQGDLFSSKVIAALRNEFAGHRVAGEPASLK
ncbi:MAG: phosphogluconate dehydrogenase (NAD(+)-dependent, decarboxylating) [Leptospirales bacterium]